MDKLYAWLGKYKYAMLVLLLGLTLLLLPERRPAVQPEKPASAAEAPQKTACAEAEDAEARLAGVLREIDGAGEVRVLLSYRCSAETEYAADDGETVVVSNGGGRQTAVARKTIYPEYLGAVIVCDGADTPRVRLQVTEAAGQFTGLGADKISVLKRRADTA